MIYENISLNDKNWFKTGGNARFFTEPEDEVQFSAALEFAKTHKLELFVLGEGANILIADSGFNGLVIRPKMKRISIENELVCSEAGVTIQELIDFCLDKQLIGLEEFSGIPGTIGGAIFINIHYFDFFLSHFLVKAKIIDNNAQTFNVDSSWFQFGYNTSRLKDKTFFLLNATFKLKKVDALQTAYNKGRRDETIRHRHRRYPTANTCGSFFRNFHQEELGSNKIKHIAYYLDNVGIKGTLSHGGASVSHLHANMIVNNGNATSSDIITLATKMQKLVYNKFKIIPIPECIFIGFQDYPLNIFTTTTLLNQQII